MGYCRSTRRGHCPFFPPLARLAGEVTMNRVSRCFVALSCLVWLGSVVVGRARRTTGPVGAAPNVTASAARPASCKTGRRRGPSWPGRPRGSARASAARPSSATSCTRWAIATARNWSSPWMSPTRQAVVGQGHRRRPPRRRRLPRSPSTPTIDGRRLYTLGINGDLVCMDVATDDRLAAQDLVHDFGGGIPNWGYAESVLVEAPGSCARPAGPRPPSCASKSDGNRCGPLQSATRPPTRRSSPSRPPG